MRRLFASLALLLAAAAPMTAPVAAWAKADAIHIGLGPAPDTLDPHKAGSVYSATVLRELFEGLVMRDAEANLIPGAAESWTISADGLTYTFKLRADAKWSDGSPVTAEDWVWSWRRAVDPATRPYFTNLLYAIENAAEIVTGAKPPESLGVRAVDPLTFEVRLARPDPNLLAYTSHQATYPVHRPSVEKHGDEFTKPGNLVSNGPWVLTEAVPQTHFRLARNPHFHDAETVRLAEAWFHITDDQSTEVKRFRAGELHITERVPQTQLTLAREQMADSLRIHPMTVARFLTPNLTRAPWKDNPGLRRALYLALDRDAMAKALDGGETPAYSLIPAGLENYSPAKLDDQRLTQAERDDLARKLLAEAGYGPGGKPLRVTLMHSSTETVRRVAVMVAAMWKQKLGIDTTLDNQEFRVTVAKTRTKDYDIAMRGWRSITPVYALENFRERDPSNNPGYASPAFEDLMTRAETALDIETSYDLLRQAEALLIQDAAVIPLFFEASRRLVSPKVKGYADNLQDIHPVRWMRLE